MFSRGRILLPHLRNRLSPESIRANLCLGAWVREGLVSAEDLREIAEMEDVMKGDPDWEEEGEGEEGEYW